MKYCNPRNKLGIETNENGNEILQYKKIIGLYCPGFKN
jgi:hypothetical protein